eukprot:gene7853-8702_t
MPLSVVFEFVLKVRNWVIFQKGSAPHLHKQRVEQVIKEVKQWQIEGCSTQMCTARPGWMTVSLRVGKYKKSCTKIHLNLYDILEIDTDNRTVSVEPQVTMGQLTTALVPVGWTIPVVPELDDLTVAGLIMGCGVETSSHKYGLFQHICTSFDIVTADGNLLHCTETVNKDLFYGIPWSHGTLGFLVAAKLRIIPAKKYVKLNYTPVLGLDKIIEKFREEAKNTDENDFVECLMYAKDKAVVMNGKMVEDEKDVKINSIGKFWKPWFYKHVEMFLCKNQTSTELIPLREYYHRHTRSLFWEMQDIISFGNHPVFRYLFGWAMPPKISLMKITSPKILLELYENKHAVQDMVVPMDQHLNSILEFFHDNLELYPLWLCPVDLKTVPGFVHPKGDKNELFVDIGAYGTPRSQTFNGPATISKIEKFVIEHNGFQLLYADSYLSRSDFYKMFDHSLYNKLRQKGEANSCEKAFPEVYDKVSRAART